MTVITIRENQANPQQANVNFDNTGEYPFALPEPLTEKEEQVLGWYFEQYITDPDNLVQGSQADQARTILQAYGRSLFHAVFSHPKAFARYQTAVTTNGQPLTFEIIGSYPFHNWHWEALQDPDSPTPFVITCPMIRSTFNPPLVEYQQQPSPTLNLLVVVARPGQSSTRHSQDVGYRTISRPLVESLRQAKVPVQIDFIRPGSYRALTDHLRATSEAKGKGYYHILHFDLHGALLTHDQWQTAVALNRFVYGARYGRSNNLPAYSGQKAFLFFENDDPEGQKSDPASAEEIAALLQQHAIPTVILNACQSGKQIGGGGDTESETSLGSRLLQAGVRTVLAMSYSVTVTAAKVMMPALYRHLFTHNNLPQAIGQARYALYNQKERPSHHNHTIFLEDWLLPVVYQTGGAHAPAGWLRREFTDKEQAAYSAKQASRYRATEPLYGFVGRDLDILHIEKRLLSPNEQPHNVLMLRGMGGAGKSTLLHHLGEWWQTTGLVGEVFYFGYDEQAWRLPQILNTIAQSLLNRGPLPTGMQVQPAYNSFLTSTPAGQMAQIAQRLRAERHLLILDNLESVTGELLSIRHTLTEAEQKELRAFLAELRGGQSLLLLGTRGGEAWLTNGPNPVLREDEIYALPGLDPESAEALAEQILQRQVKEPSRRARLRQDPDYRRLLNLLNGFPLALQVVLANLSRQEPSEIVAALQAGQVARLDIAKGDITTSILRCVEYAHGNLSREAQTLLLCLAPFTGVIHLNWLPQYTEALQSQPALADLPFGQWAAVLQEAGHWGLLTAHDLPGYAHIQPIFPYFLRSKLHSEGESLQEAIATAYRQHYDDIGGALRQMMRSQEPPQRQAGHLLAGLEYENITTALEYALAAYTTIANTCFALSDYLDGRQEHQRGLALGQRVLTQLETAPAHLLAGPLGMELVGVLDDTAKRYLLLQQYPAAQTAYQKALALIEPMAALPAAQRGGYQASVYHQLGAVAQEQRQWAAAESAYRQALAIFQEFNDRYRQASTYHNLGAVAQEQRQWAAAESAYRQALAIYQKFKDRYEQASTYHQLGRVVEEQQRWEEAKTIYNEALFIYKNLNESRNEAITYRLLGRVAERQRQLLSAEEAYRQALFIYKELNDSHNEAITYNLLGRVTEKQRQSVPQRLVNTGFALPNTPAIPISRFMPLTVNQPVYFWLEIGERVLGSIETGRAPLPDNLPAHALLEVVLFPFEGEFALQEVLGRCQITARGEVRVQQKPFPLEDPLNADLLTRRLFFRLRPTAVGKQRFRCHIYHQQTLLQARLIEAEVQQTPALQDSPVLMAHLDHSIAKSFAPSHLHRLGETRLSLMLNSQDNATHTLRLFGLADGRQQVAYSSRLSAHALQSLITEARQLLWRVTWDGREDLEDDDRYRYPAGAAARDQRLSYLRDDLIRLARYGAALYDALINQIAESHHEQLRTMMRQPGQVQIALKEFAQSILPAALLYDYKLDDGSPLSAIQICPEFWAAMQANRPLADTVCFREGCPHAGVGFSTIVCPSGFWGYRHALGLTVSTERDTPIAITTPAKPLLVMGIATELADWQAHGEALAQLPLALTYAQNREEVIAKLQQGMAQVMYFYCHGGLEGQRPYLQFGPNDSPRFTRATIRNADIRWQNPHPLVFINGCHTAALEPDKAIDLVTGFMENAQAAGVIGTEITIFEGLAAPFARTFLRYFLLERKPAGLALRDARLDALQSGNPLGLVYIPYLFPSLQLASAP